MRMSEFNPLRIEVDMMTSIVHSNTHPIHLDGLLYWAIYSMNNNHEKIIEVLDETLSKSQDVYHASQALYEKSSSHNILAKEITRITRTDWKEFDGILTKPKKTIKENEGVFCKKFTLKLATQVKRIIFFAHGNHEKIQFYLNSILGIGLQANSGFGEIAKVKVVRIVDDHSWFLDEKLNRILPKSMFYMSRNEPVRSCRYKPNYKSSDVVDCYIPTNNTLVV